MGVIQLAKGLLNPYSIVGTFQGTGDREWKNSPRPSLLKLTFLWKETDNEKKKKHILCPEDINAIDKNNSG